MKKIVLGLAAVLLILTLAGCPGVNQPGNSPTATSLAQKLNAGGNVDLGYKEFAEDAAINTANITVSNANLGGKTLTINKAGVTLKNITNANLVIGEGVGNGDVTVDSCSFNNVTVNGGGENSIHFKTTTVKRVVVSKQYVRVVLEGNTKVTSAEISGNGAKLEAAANSTAKVTTLEVAPNTSDVQIQKIEATNVVLKENVENVKVTDVKAEKLEVQAAANVILEGETEVETAELKGNNAKIEAAADETTGATAAKVGTLEVAANTSDIQIQKIEATSVTIKANVKNVTISEVKADTLAVQEKAENTTITGTTVKTIEIEKEVEKIKIEACVIKTAKVSDEAGNIEVAGGEVETLQVVKTQTTTQTKAVITITKSETVIKDAQIVISGGTVTAQPVSLAISSDVNTDVLDIPDDVETEIVDIPDDDPAIVDDPDDDDPAIVDDPDNDDPAIVDDPDDDDPAIVDDPDDDDPAIVDDPDDDDPNIVDDPDDDDPAIPKPDYIGQGVEFILDGLYDEGVAQFRRNYEENPDSNEAKMFYALAELAAISTDESIATLLEDYFNIEGYPATMNALINGDWLEETPKAKRINTYRFDEDDDDGTYIRCNIDESEERHEYYISYLYDSDYDHWINPNTSIYDDESGTLINNYLYITGVAYPDDDGPYMIYYYNYCTHINNEYVSLPEGTQRWEIVDSLHSYVLDGTIFLPQIKLSDWFKESQAYENSLIKGVKNTETLSEALLANFLECNPNGVNELLDDCIALFDNEKIENARTIVNSMDDNITIPVSILSAFNLDQMLGTDEIYFGKAEFNILLSALDIVKGTLQFISSYDLSANLYELKQLVVDALDNLPEEAAENLITENTLAPRTDASNRIAAAKASYIGAIDTILESYTAMFGDGDENVGYYPEMLAEMVGVYADPFLPGLTELRDAIEEEGVFYLPGIEWDEEEEEMIGSPVWLDEANPETDFGIDFGKLFTPGYFSGIIQKDEQGKAPLYAQMIVEYDYYNYSSSEITLNPEPTFIQGDRLEYKYTTVPVLKAEWNEEAILADLKNEYKASGYTSAYIRIYYGYLFKPQNIVDFLVNAPSFMTEDTEDTVMDIVFSPRYNYNPTFDDWELDN